MAGARDVVVPCEGGGHRVRLARGIRFWAGARCPRCRTKVDPFRVRRVATALAGLRRPVGRGIAHRSVWLASIGWTGAIVAAALLLWIAADYWWPATVLLFGPRWVLVLPLALLLPAALLLDRALLPVLAFGALVAIGPLLGFRSGWRGWTNSADPTSTTVRVATFNARGGVGLAMGPGALVASWGADLAAFQECGGHFSDAFAVLEEGWYASRVSFGLCLVSRYPIVRIEQMDRAPFEAVGGAGMVVTWTLDVEGVPIRVTNLHLETPRAGFELIRSGRVGEGIRRTREISARRQAELRRAALWIEDQQPPHLVLGDFNTPPESRIYRLAFRDWQNAFSVAGFGLGGTRLNGWIRARIDHVLADDRWIVLDARLGEDVGSDHLPMIATLVLR